MHRCYLKLMKIGDTMGGYFEVGIVSIVHKRASGSIDFHTSISFDVQL